MRTIQLLLIGSTLALVAACGNGRVLANLEPSFARCQLNTGALPPGCVKTEGGELGQVGNSFQAGSASVVITGWTSKNGEAGEYIAFSYDDGGAGAVISVKAGGEKYLVSTPGSWSHPAGPQGSAISNIVFCPPGTDPDGGGGGGGDDAPPDVPPQDGCQDPPLDDGSGTPPPESGTSES
jgi:hypothetical protein